MESAVRKILEGERSDLVATGASALLAPAGWCYGAAAALRALLYRRGVLQSRRLPRPVISIGNLTAGGTGKTPMAMHVARHFLARGKRVTVLSRGYRRSGSGILVVSDGRDILCSPREAGDEPYLIAASVPGVAVVVGADRYAAGIAALEATSPDIFILDDGFQHLRLQRDLDIVLLDTRRPFGNGRILPAGLLREPASGLKRASLLVYTRCTGETPRTLDIPSVCSRHHLTGLCSKPGDPLLPFSALTEKKVAAFAGIASPGSFFAALRQQGMFPVAEVALRDHCDYGGEEMAAIAREAAAAGAECMVTTEKDMVKLRREEASLPLYAARMAVEFDDDAPLRRLLERL